MLSKQALEEFKTIYKEEYKKEITDAETSRLANGLINLFSILNKSSIIVRSAVLSKKK